MLRMVVCAAATLAWTPVAAQPHVGDAADDRHHEARPIGFAEALRAAHEAPALRAAGGAARSWRGAIASGRRPTVRALAAPGWVASAPAVELEVAAGWTPGRAAAARAAASSAVDALEAGVAADRREYLAAAASAWLAAWAARGRLIEADEELARAEALVALADRGRAFGVATRVDQAAAAAYRLEIEAAHLDAEGRVLDAELALAGAIGDGEGAPRRADGDLPSLELDGPVVPWRARAERAEALAAVRGGAAARAAAGRLYEVGARAELGAGGHAGFVLLGLTWPGGDRGGLEAAAAAARAAQLEGQAVASERADAVAQTRARHEVEHARALASVRARRVDALAEHVVALEASVAAGEAVLAETVPARRALAMARAELIDARAAVAAAEVERALLAGWEGP